MHRQFVQRSIWFKRNSPKWQGSSSPKRLFSEQRGRFVNGAAVNGFINGDTNNSIIPGIHNSPTASGQSSKNTTNTIKGESLDLAADLRTFRPGDKLDIPYEMTISESMQDFWQSVCKIAS